MNKNFALKNIKKLICGKRLLKERERRECQVKELISLNFLYFSLLPVLAIKYEN